MLEKDGIIYRPARKEDCLQMQEIINFYADQGLMLKKSTTQLMTMIHSFFVAVCDGSIIATCGYKIWADSLVEIISLAVKEEFQKRGIGFYVPRLCIKKAHRLGFREFFALSVAPDLFKRLGFQKADHRLFNAKIWADCLYCTRNAGGPGDPKCNETPLLLKL